MSEFVRFKSLTLHLTLRQIFGLDLHSTLVNLAYCKEKNYHAHIFSLHSTLFSTLRGSRSAKAEKLAIIKRKCEYFMSAFQTRTLD
jgi:hypothetical protein